MTIFITGGSRGFGYHLSDIFLSNGYKVGSIFRTKNNPFNSNNNFSFFNYDLGLKGIDKISKKLDKYLDSTEVLILNSAVTGIYEIDLKKIDNDYLYNVNYNSNIYILDKFLPYIGKKKGTIVYITTKYGKLDGDDKIFNNYIDSKKSFQDYFVSITKNYPDITFIVFSPGNMYTSIYKNMLNSSNEFIKKKAMKNIILKDISLPEKTSKLLFEIITNTNKQENKNLFSYFISFGKIKNII